MAIAARNLGKNLLWPKLAHCALHSGGLVELAMKIDADGNLKDMKMVCEYPPLAGFGEQATDDFRGAKFVPAFREGKPVESSITLPVFYEFEETPVPPVVPGAPF